MCARACARAQDHATVFQTRQERVAEGRPVDNLAGGGQGYEALGGITDFSSLADGAERAANQQLPFTRAAGRLLQARPPHEAHKEGWEGEFVGRLAFLMLKLTSGDNKLRPLASLVGRRLDGYHTTRSNPGIGSVSAPSHDL